jgi:hypothetical protein
VSDGRQLDRTYCRFRKRWINKYSQPTQGGKNLSGETAEQDGFNKKEGFDLYLQLNTSVAEQLLKNTSGQARSKKWPS